MTTTEIKAQLRKLRQRQTDLHAEVEAARLDLKEAQSDQLEGKGGATERVAAVQGQVTGSIGTLEMLAARIASTEEALRESEAKDEVERRKKEMVQLAENASSFRREHEAALEELARIFTERSEAIASAFVGWREAAISFGEHAEAIQAHGIAGADLARDLEGVDLDSVLSDRMSTRRNFTRKRYEYRAPNLGAFGNLLVEALQKSETLRRIEVERERGTKNGTAVAESPAVEA